MNQIREIQWQSWDATVLNPLGLSLTIAMCFIIFFAKRKYVILAFIIIACFIPTMQKLVLFKFNFLLLRILTICGFIRIFFLKKERSFKLNKIDKLMICWGIYRIIAHTLLYRQTAAFIETLGNSFDTIGVYFIVRLILYELDDFKVLFKTLILLSILVTIFMINEKITGSNIFYIFGGVPEFTAVREGKLRAQGGFDHPIMAGSFGAFLLPIAINLWYDGLKKYAVIGFITSITITIASSSSGPMLAYLSGIFGFFIWKYRNKISLIKWSVITIILFLQFVMKSSVWFLLARIDIAGGSTGYHRAALIDAAITNFSDWFLLGIRDTSGWGWGLQDTTNQFIFEGEYGGVLQLILFILIIRNCFKTIGSITKLPGSNVQLQKKIWSIGVILFVHVISFMGVSYFGQMNFFYYFTLGSISSLNNFHDFDEIKLQENEKNKISSKLNFETSPA